MEYQHIIYEQEGPIATITFNIPEKQNTLDLIGMSQDALEFHDALDRSANDDDIKVVVLKGNGPGFCAGERLDKVYKVYGGGTGEPGERRPSQRIRLRTDKRFMEGFRKLFLHPKVTIAQSHGYSFGIGTMLLLFCDIVIAADDAQLGFIDQRVGSGGTSNGYFTILVQTVGLKRALDLVLTTRLFDGKEAAQMGLITKSVPEEQLAAEVAKYAKVVSYFPADGIAIGKAARHLAYDAMGTTKAFTSGYIMHTLFTNLRWEEDEYSFIRSRRDSGTGKALQGMNERYKGLVDNGIRKIPPKK